MAFTNRIRLPFKLHKPQFQEDIEKYRKGNGVTVTLSVVIRKIYEGITDEMPEKLHDRLKIALAHDTVHVEGDKYVGVIAQEGDYAIEWSDFLSRPIAQAKFRAEVTPFNATNSNCGTCETYSQVIAEDDDIGSVDEGDTINVDVLDNDSICCSPITISIITVNSTYVSGITIEPDNTLTLVFNTPLAPANGVVVATYRAECDNGLYDDANIIANVNGSLPPECLAPLNLFVGSITSSSAQATWDAPSPAPDSYDWELYLASDLVTPILTGNTIDLYADFDSLTPETVYRVYVNSNCGGGESNAVWYGFVTGPAAVDETCGQYEVFNTGAFPQVVQYIDCEGTQQTLFLASFITRTICAMQYSPGNPVDMISSSNVTITYLGLC